MTNLKTAITELAKFKKKPLDFKLTGYVYRKHSGTYGYVSAMGRSYFYIDCPFCNEPVKCFKWSISGGGKNCKCGAKLLSDLEGAKKLKDNA